MTTSVRIPLRNFAAPVLLLAALAGCSRFASKPQSEYVYVLQKQAFLRDHVAAVSNRTGTVTNGDRLLVLEHGKRFIRVKDDKGETGWIEERYTTPDATRGEFDKLAAEHAGDPAVASALVRDEVYMHAAPGRDTDRFYLLEEGDKLNLLARASMPKPLPPQSAAPSATPAKPTPKPASTDPNAPKKHNHGPAPVEGEPSIPMEDWWLAKDAHGHYGWVLGRRFDVDIPEAISGYSEGQRFVGAYQLTTVHDDDSGMPNGEVPIWLTLTVPYKDGLPYDYNQVRVFGWNTKKHRYETDYRERDLWGYLPVKIAVQQWPNVKQPEPSFTLQTDPDKSTTIDATTGIARPAQLNQRPYRMEGALVYRILPQVPKEPKASTADSPQPTRRKATKETKPRKRRR